MPTKEAPRFPPEEERGITSNNKSPEEINGTIISAKAGNEDTYKGSLVHGQKINNVGYKVSCGWSGYDMFYTEVPGFVPGTLHQYDNRNAFASDRQ